MTSGFSNRAAPALLSSLALAIGGAAGCSRGSGETEAPEAVSSTGASGGTSLLVAEEEVVLIPEFEGPCARKSGPGAIEVDVNLGHTPEAFVRAAYCQVKGEEPTPDVLAEWSERLRTEPHTRRIDWVHTLCRDAGRPCSLVFSDPWQAHADLRLSCVKKTSRDLGAVFMLFSDCPGGVNCSMTWANTHAPGMQAPHPLFGWGERETGFYNPKNPGFWFRSLLDARYAGLQFLLLNIYGPELDWPEDVLAQMGAALDALDGGVKVALFDDPDRFREGSSPPWNAPPSFDDPLAAAQTLYDLKWKPFYSSVDPEHWYSFRGRPFIYFYNAGTLGPRERSTPVVARLKELFHADFDVVPFVAVDQAYFADETMASAADARFAWDTFHHGGRSRSTLHGAIVDHFMPKWDSLGRDEPGTVASPDHRMAKGPELLQQYLNESADADLAVIATFNDLGEGTGIGRNYDYYYDGTWLTPQAFMRVTRQAQCE